MKTRLLFAPLAVALSGGLLHAQPAPTLRFVATSYPVYLTVLNVAWEIPGVEVSCLPPGALAQRHGAPPAAASILARADALVAHGAGLELFLDETAIRFPNLAIIELAEKVARPGKEEERLPWIWMSVSDTIKEVRRLRAVLKKFDRPRREGYALNAERYVARLEALRDRMKGAFDPFRKLRVVALDGASARFAREARLEVVTAASPDEAIAVVKQTNARLVLVDLRLREEEARRIARETRRPVCVIDPLSGGPDHPDAYLQIMEENLKSLRSALQQATRRSRNRRGRGS
ncbi:MAG: zinc ABC transporter substrate-binding protein [Candidatus Aureabacteria bacterium]|jgi:ABC-type Zn uptake system ZnuABC Zn-binding protein ZnuA|nr:zinc ABC transporter substrate-binding protein [Candidatus Auribacterota bacterium]NLW93441.1 zinc ABC transporter solute-binding protein [Chlamydiota bacterium]HOE26951.1 metal ABC transporter substrate-binding protein [bacterium]HQM52275.1 metal ABC transporter substrate-binding protein [bacterium]